MAEKQGILFLDIDEVLCTFRARAALGDMYHALDPAGILWINRICEQHHLKIVIISTWRLDAPDMFPDNTQNARGYLIHRGMKAELFHNDWKTPALVSRYRGDEINEWIATNGMPEKILIIDDGSDFHLWQKNFLVRADQMDGILHRHMAQAETILQKQKKGLRLIASPA